MMKCEQVMTKNPVCCFQNDDVVKAAKLMKREDIGSIPIIEDAKTNKLVGILTDRDLAIKVIAEGRVSQSVLVGQVMTRDLITCSKDDDLQKAMDLMAEHQLRRIPIVNSENMIVGIISQADVATRFDQPEKTASMVKEISQP